MQRVTASAGTGIVKRLPKIIAPEEPFKTASRGPAPVLIPGKRICFETGGNHRMSFQWLLIEPGSLAAAGPEAIASNRREMSGFAFLSLNQPAQGFQPDIECFS